MAANAAISVREEPMTMGKRVRGHPYPVVNHKEKA
jgi:hypothetical protein